MSAGQRAGRETPLRLAAEVTATALFWGLWLYVVMPLVSLLLWLAGVQVFVEQMITLGGYEAFLEKLMTYGLVVLAIMLTIFAWVLWNVKHYGKRNTRSHELAAVTLAETAEAAGMEIEAVEKLQYLPRMILAFDDQKRLMPMLMPDQGQQDKA
jgi:poly-beta-1,6-N-acetyl-D-glucosamine biosynthesis protein PgaD